jgi:hypothetical protein
MKNLRMFWHFFKESAEEIFANKKVYLPAFLALLVLGNMETLFPFLGVNAESNIFILLTVITSLLTFVVLSEVVLIQKKKHGGTGELSFFVPTFLLYNIYYSFLFFLGLILLVVPGFYALIYFSMVPFIAVLDDETSGKFFSKSRELVKKNTGLVAWASVIGLLLEFSALLLTPVQDPVLKMILTFFYSIPDAFLTLVITLAMVKIYYYLKNL